MISDLFRFACRDHCTNHPPLPCRPQMSSAANSRTKSPAGKLGIYTKRRRSASASARTKQALKEKSVTPPRHFALKKARSAAPKSRVAKKPHQKAAKKTKPNTEGIKEPTGPGPKPEGKRIVKKKWVQDGDAEDSDEDGKWVVVSDSDPDPECKWDSDSGQESEEGDEEDDDAHDTKSDTKQNGGKSDSGDKTSATAPISGDRSAEDAKLLLACKCGSANSVGKPCASCKQSSTASIEPSKSESGSAAAAVTTTIRVRMFEDAKAQGAYIWTCECGAVMLTGNPCDSKSCVKKKSTAAAAAPVPATAAGEVVTNGSKAEDPKEIVVSRSLL